VKLKRLLDIYISSMGLLILTPLWITVAMAVRLDSAGPIFHRATRIGKNGQPFRVIKFRTMAVNADKIGPGITTAGDSRITSVGRFLRRTKLDELPQLTNVLCGEMSLVGPRPEDPRYVDLYTNEQRRVLIVRPGMTSLASVRYRHEEKLLKGAAWEEVYINRVMPDKLALDLYYIEQQNLWLDLKIIWQTGVAIFK
jgi:lipopolysaccharide/colanic/teichoic acid biosynthesis glycosyltransferase